MANTRPAAPDTDSAAIRAGTAGAHASELHARVEPHPHHIRSSQWTARGSYKAWGLGSVRPLRPDVPTTKEKIGSVCQRLGILPTWNLAQAPPFVEEGSQHTAPRHPDTRGCPFSALATAPRGCRRRQQPPCRPARNAAALCDSESDKRLIAAARSLSGALILSFANGNIRLDGSGKSSVLHLESLAPRVRFKTKL